MKRFLAVGALLLALGASARADSFSANITQGSTGQNLDNFTGPQYAGTFTVSDTTTQSGTYTAFCADLTDHVGFGSYPFTGTWYTGGMNPSNVPDSIWKNTYSDLGARLDYVLTHVMAPAEGSWATPTAETQAEAAAVQAVIWNLMGNYGYNPGGSPLVDKYVSQLMTLVGAPGSSGSGVSGSSWALLNGLTAYVKGNSYASSEEFLIVPGAGGGPTGDGPLQYQVLIGVVPEPSTFAIAGLGALGLLGYGWKRRRSS